MVVLFTLQSILFFYWHKKFNIFLYLGKLFFDNKSSYDLENIDTEKFSDCSDSSETMMHQTDYSVERGEIPLELFSSAIAIRDKNPISPIKKYFQNHHHLLF